MRLVSFAAGLLLALAGCTSEEVPPERLFEGGEFCLDERQWPAVIAYTKKFGSARGLRFEGGANAYEGAGLNIGLLKGDGWFKEETIALYVVSNPFEQRKAVFFAKTREKMTAADTAIATRFGAGLRQFACDRFTAAQRLEGA